jgi:hypothetical protein
MKTSRASMAGTAGMVKGFWQAGQLVALPASSSAQAIAWLQ